MKKNRSGIIALLLIVLVSGFLLMNSHDANIDMHKMSDGSAMDDKDMQDQHMNMTVSSEREFIAGMIPHHQEAIDTAGEVIERGGSTAEIKSLAEGIIIAQVEEIERMKLWYEDWYGVTYEDKSDYMPMMRDLSQLSGPELDKVFLEDMIVHHKGAIVMAESVMLHIEHDEIDKLAKEIIKTQSEEIELMERILDEI